MKDDHMVKLQSIATGQILDHFYNVNKVKRAHLSWSPVLNGPTHDLATKSSTIAETPDAAYVCPLIQEAKNKKRQGLAVRKTNQTSGLLKQF